MGNERENLPLYPAVHPNPHIMASSAPSMDNQFSPNAYQPMLLGPENTMTTCIYCKASIKTAVKYTSNTRTHIAAALCSLICCCCCLPYCMDTAKNADHFCPSCKRYLGTYHR